MCHNFPKKINRNESVISDELLLNIFMACLDGGEREGEWRGVK